MTEFGGSADDGVVDTTPIPEPSSLALLAAAGAAAAIVRRRRKRPVSKVGADMWPTLRVPPRPVGDAISV
jgi:hypothetical protein